MAQCMQVTDSGQVQLLNTAPAQCQQLIVLQPADYASLQTAANIWSADPAQFAQAFGVSFVLVLTCYVVSDGFGQLLRFFQKDM